MKKFELRLYSASDRTDLRKRRVSVHNFEEATVLAYRWRSALGAPFEWKIKSIREVTIHEP